MPARKKLPGEPVSERDTKQDIWGAYNQLLLQVEGAPVEVKSELTKQALPEALKKLADIKITLSRSLEEAGEETLTELNTLQELKALIGRDKKEIIGKLEEQKTSLANEIGKVKILWDEEKRSQEVERKRADDEYRYNLSQERRLEKDEYEKAKSAREAVLADREKAVSDREKEIKEMERQITAFPTEVESAAEKAREVLGKELTDKYERQIIDLKHGYESDARVSAVRAENLQSQVKSQATEIESLKRQVADTSRQLKEMAVAAIGGRANSGGQSGTEKSERTENNQ